MQAATHGVNSPAAVVAPNIRARGAAYSVPWQEGAGWSTLNPAGVTTGAVLLVIVPCYTQLSVPLCHSSKQGTPAVEVSVPVRKVGGGPARPTAVLRLAALIPISTVLSRSLQLEAFMHVVYALCVECCPAAYKPVWRLPLCCASLITCNRRAHLNRPPGLGPCKRGPLTRLACWQALSRQVLRDT